MLNIKKKKIDNINKAYAVNTLMVDGRLKLMAASEGRGALKLYDYETGEQETIWEKPGGTMNIVPIPGRDGEFLATQRFFPVFDARNSVLVYGRYGKATGKWDVKEVLELPYLHRFDVIEIDGKLIFIGASLCSGKKEVQDWSKPGKLYIGHIPGSIFGDWDLKVAYEGITKNHGYWLQREQNCFFVSGVEGMFEVKIPNTPQGEFSVNKAIDREISDMAVCDIDGDGVCEIATIEMFHGNELAINKPIDGKYQKVFCHPIEFGHVIWGGEILDKPMYIVGGRRGDCKIEYITFENGRYTVSLLDQNVGPSQLSVFESNGESVALSANRQQNEVAVYTFKKAF